MNESVPLEVVERSALYTSAEKHVVLERRLVRCDEGDTHVVYWVGVSESPSGDEILRMVHFMVERILCPQQGDDRFIILAEHTSSVPLRLPDMSEFQVIVELLASHRELVRDRVVCTVVQTRRLDGIAKIGHISDIVPTAKAVYHRRGTVRDEHIYSWAAAR